MSDLFSDPDSQSDDNVVVPRRNQVEMFWNENGNISIMTEEYWGSGGCENVIEITSPKDALAIAAKLKQMAKDWES